MPSVIKFIVIYLLFRLPCSFIGVMCMIWEVLFPHVASGSAARICAVFCVRLYLVQGKSFALVLSQVQISSLVEFEMY